MFSLMAVLAGLGLVLLFVAPAMARFLVGRRGGDPVGLTRIFWAIAVVLLLAALLVRPHNTDTAVFPPPPGEVEP